MQVGPDVWAAARALSGMPAAPFPVQPDDPCSHWFRSCGAVSFNGRVRLIRPGKAIIGPSRQPGYRPTPRMSGTPKRLASGPCRLRHGHFVACHRAGMPVACVLSRHLVRRASPHADRIPRMSLAVSHSGSAGSKLPARLAPAVLVSAPASGHGKTTVVAALARRLSRAGLDVRVFKTGRDPGNPARS